MSKTPHPLPDNSLIHSFETLYKKFALPLMKFLVKRVGGDQETAEEIFSQTILAAWKGFSTFENKATFFTWICRIALNKMADYYRNQIHERSILIAPTLEDIANIHDKNLTPEEAHSLEELRKTIKECLLLLPEDKRQLLYLRFWKDLSIKKIAEILGMSERSVEGKIYRAKQELKVLLASKHPDIIPAYLPQTKR